MNVWGEQDWDWEGAGRDAPAGYGGNVRRLPRGRDLGASLYQLPPGATQAPYHFHHGAEELLVVLRGRPTLRTPDGVRELEEGEAVHFPVGPSGAHQLSNRTDEPARYLFFGSLPTPEVVEYPDSGKVLAMAKPASEAGDPLWSMHRREDAVGYFDGEPPRS
jgi:uncharacterized cupin superfamily protein